MKFMDQKGISSIVIILIIVGVLGLAGGVWYYLVKTTPIGPGVCPTDTKVCADGSTVKRISPACEFAACPDPTVNWKTYRNEEYGFEVKYPGTQNVERVPNVAGPKEGQLAYLLIEIPLGEVPTNYLSVTMVPTTDYDCAEESKWFLPCDMENMEKICEKGKNTEVIRKNIAIDDYSTVLISRYESIYVKPQLTKASYTCVQKNSKTVSFTFNINGHDRSKIESQSYLVDQILSTFKFTK